MNVNSIVLLHTGMFVCLSVCPLLLPCVSHCFCVSVCCLLILCYVSPSVLRIALLLEEPRIPPAPGECFYSLCTWLSGFRWNMLHYHARYGNRLPSLIGRVPISDGSLF